MPGEPDAPRGAFTAAHAAKDQGVQSPRSRSAPGRTVHLDDQDIPVPVDDSTLRKIARSPAGRRSMQAAWISSTPCAPTLQRIIGYEMIPGDASAAWIRLGALSRTAALLAAALLNRWLPD